MLLLLLQWQTYITRCRVSLKDRLLPRYLLCNYLIGFVIFFFQEILVQSNLSVGILYNTDTSFVANNMLTHLLKNVPIMWITSIKDNGHLSPYDE